MIKLLISILLISLVYCEASSQHRCGHFSKNRSLNAADSRSDSLDIIHTHLNLDFTDFSSQILTAEAHLIISAKVDGIFEVDLDLKGLNVSQVLLNSEELIFTHEDALLKVTLNQIYNENDQFELTVFYGGSPITDNSGWGGFYWNTDFAFNLGVGFDADPHSFGRAWFPCFDNFVERCTFSFSAITEFPKKAIFNGLPVNSFEGVTDDSGLTTTSWEMDTEIPSYLASVAIGNYNLDITQHFSTPNDSVPMWLIAPENNLTQISSSFQNLSPTASIFEEFYGTYQWSKIGYVFVPFNSGAMEHATNIAYPISFADGSLDFETLMAHELAHHWWGDYVTCSTAEDMWINEGMASFSEALFLEQQYGPESYFDWITDNHRDVLLYAHLDDGSYLPVSGIGQDNTYGSHVYNKGASVGHNLRGYMGDDAFILACRGFMEEYALQSVSSTEMKDYFQQFTERNLTAFFADWVFNPGFIDFSIDNTQINELSPNLFEITLAISQRVHEAPEYFTDMPINLTLLSETGTEEDHTVNCSGALTTITIQSTFSPKHIILNRNYTLTPAILAEEKTIVDTGLDNFSFAEFRSDINEMNSEDSLWIRVECHFTGPHELQPQSEYVISTDRFWRIMGDFPENIDAGGRLRYFGGETGSFTFDSQFFDLMENNAMTETEIILLYREDGSSPWTEHENYEVNPQGTETDFIGRIDFLDLKEGDYAWAYETGVFSVNENSKELKIFPNPVQDEIMVTGGLNKFSSYKILDSNGRLALSGRIVNNYIKCESITPGSYALQLFNDSEKLILTQIFLKVRE